MAPALAVSLLLPGCGRLPVEGEEPAPDVPATIVRRVDATEGPFNWWVEIDSASARYRLRCVPLIGIACTGSLTPREGVLSPSTVQRVFRDAHRSEFRALLAEYDMSGTYVDGPAYSITVVANGRRRRIRWSDAARLPDVLVRFSDLVLMAADVPVPDRL